MVNTRQSEAMSVVTRRRKLYNTDKGTTDDDSSEEDCAEVSSEEEQPLSHGEKENENWKNKWVNEALTNRVRELRNRFVCSPQKRTYARTVRKRLKSRMVHNNQRVFISNDGDADSEELEDEPDNSNFPIFSPTRKRATRSHGAISNDRRIVNDDRLVRSTEISYGRRAKETRQINKNEVITPRGGLRPLKRSSYADPHSPYSQDVENSSDEKPDIEIRRSKRQRKFKYNTFNTSWITEHQMIRGYPKFKREIVMEDHEEDSKDNNENDLRKEQEDCSLMDSSMDNIQMKRTRRSQQSKKFVYEYIRNRRSTKELNHDRPQINGASSSSKNSEENSAQNENSQRILVNGNVKEEKSQGKKSEEQQEEAVEGDIDEKENVEHEDDSPNMNRTSRRCRRTVINYSDTRKRRNDSDSTTEEPHETKYKLRQRKPKPMIVETVEVQRRELRSTSRRRLRRKRNYKISSDSSSSSTSDDELKRNSKHTPGNSTMQLKPNRNRTVTPPRDKGKFKKDFDVGLLDPLSLDSSIKFSSIGGLDEQIRCLREMVVLPILYPDIFKEFKTPPPKGVLFHGPPGTGKTLMARALANECSTGNRKVAFFLRKGADLLSKWIGQTEKQMRQLFEQAAAMAPSIIFFDELDGLAPARTARQEQVHVSVVASLLSLMDGLDKNRGEVIVIGATNRPDAIDPALRRPGRFDREIYFPLPSAQQRKDILRIVVSDWKEPPNEELLMTLAERSPGYCGADLRALCTEAVFRAVRRTYPQIYESSYRLLVDPSNIKVEKCDFDRAAQSLVPAGCRGTLLHVGFNIPSYLEPLLKNVLIKAEDLILQMYPVANKNCIIDSLDLSLGHCAQLLIAGGGSVYVASSLLKRFEHLPTLTLDLATLHNRFADNPEQACIQLLQDARRTKSCIIYLPRINSWWEIAGDSVKVLLQTITHATNSSTTQSSILLLATVDVDFNELSDKMIELFSPYRNEILEIEYPTEIERENFFRPLIVQTPLEAVCDLPKPDVPKSYEPLPRAPTPPPAPLSPHSKQLLFEKEEETLIELRIFLRDVCKKLASNKSFYMFTKPVDLEEVPDYLDIVAQPMDLETMMTKVDLHRYSCAQEFLADVDLIQLNALTYNPDRTPADKQIRHRACWFRDYAYALIKSEMDTDFEDNCRKIAKKRRERHSGNPNEFLPEHIRALAEEDQEAHRNSAKETTPPPPPPEVIQDGILNTASAENTNVNTITTPTTNTTTATGRTGSTRKRRWARGRLTTNKKRKPFNKVVAVKEENNGELNLTPISATDEDSKEKEEIMEDMTNDSITSPVLEKGTNESISDREIKAELIEEATNDSVIDDGIDKEFDKCLSIDVNSSLKPEEERLQPTINGNHLNDVLARTVSETKNCSIDLLCDLYSQFKLVINRYKHLQNRTTLPEVLNEELNRFKKYLP